MATSGVPAPGFVKRIGPVVDERRNVEFHALESVNLMNRLTGPSMPFDWTINPYRGCASASRPSAPRSRATSGCSSRWRPAPPSP